VGVSSRALAVAVALLAPLTSPLLACVHERVVEAPLAPASAAAASDSGAPLQPPLRAPLAAERNIPFEVGQAWIGQYLCAQGLTRLELQIERVEGLHIDAVFDFEHKPTGTAGSYHVRGDYDPDARRLKLEAGDWVVHPPGYVTVDLDGRVDASGDGYSGTVIGPSCSTFQLRRAAGVAEP
jgi:hypothetical protein